MKVVQINSFSNGSTGKIMMGIHNELKEKGYDSYVVWGRGRKSNNEYEFYLNDRLGVIFHALYSRLTGKTGFASKRSTLKLLKWLDTIKPDIIHLHNVHGYYINIELLFNYIKKNNIKTIWTLHDCWAFTGQCPHFSSVGCDKWKKQCYNCPMIKDYPKAFIDNSMWNYTKKKDLFSKLDLDIVTPSIWLSNLVKQSFLKNYRIRTIYNGIDTRIFKPQNGLFKENYNLEQYKIILGVASVWDNRKGLEDFIKLSKVIDDDYRIVLVGLNKKQIKKLPNNIIGIIRTDNQESLANIYSESSVYFNASKEESFGLTTVEALSCGTPVIVYNSTALPEIVSNKYGEVIDSFDADEIYEIIKKMVTNKKKKFPSNDYDVFNMINQYISLYNEKRGEKK